MFSIQLNKVKKQYNHSHRNFYLFQGLHNKFSSEGAEEECVNEIGGGGGQGAWKLNWTENPVITIKLLMFFSITNIYIYIYIYIYRRPV